MRNKVHSSNLSKLYVLSLLIHCACTGKAQLPVKLSDNNVLVSSQLKPIGRFDFHDEKLELISSASHFGVTFEGPECLIVASAAGQHNYIQYELDGIYAKRIRIDSSSQHLKIGAGNDGKHTLWIYKATEAHTGPVFIHRVTARNVRPLEIPSRPLIEFIGNSITCGAAADASEIRCGTGSYHDQHNAYMAYGPRVARALKANFILSSVSGIGVYRNWNSDGPTMPEVYERTDFQAGSLRSWNFNTYKPEVVTIALGTNDFSNGDGKRPRLAFDSATFTRKYYDFVKQVKSKYPTSQIVLLNSPMVSGTRNDVLVQCLNRVKRQIDALYPKEKPVAIFQFKTMKGRGCTGHPSVEDHELLANELYGFLSKILK